MTGPLVPASAAVSAVSDKSFSYNEYRLTLSGALEVEAGGERFQPTEMQLTCGRPGAPGRPDRGVEVDLVGLHPVPRHRHERIHRQWESGAGGAFSLTDAPAWVQDLAVQVVNGGAGQTAGTIRVAGSRGASATIDRADHIIGTEWRIDLADAPDTAGDGVGEFHPTALIVLRSNILSRGSEFRDTVMLVGTGLARSPASGGGKCWDSDALTPRYAFASMPAWVQELIGQHTDVDPGGLVRA